MEKLRFLPLTILLILIGTCGARAQTCNRDVETQGGFSICVPDGWTVETKTGEKYKMIFAPKSEIFANINFKEGTSAASLEDYVAAEIKNLISNVAQTGATSIKVVSQSNFVTDSDLHGIKVIFSTEYKGAQFRQLQYIFSAGANRKLVVTCTSLEKDQEQLDPVFERAAKSFRLDN